MKMSFDIDVHLLDGVQGRDIGIILRNLPQGASDRTTEQMRTDREILIMLAFAAQAFLRTCSGVHTKEAEQLELTLVDARVRGLIF